MSELMVLRLHPSDDVVIAICALAAGTFLPTENVLVSGSIPPGHKLAVRQKAPGEPIRRYDQVIGFASRPISSGEHVHVHNLEVQQFSREYAVGTAVKKIDYPRVHIYGYTRIRSGIGHGVGCRWSKHCVLYDGARFSVRLRSSAVAKIGYKQCYMEAPARGYGYQLWGHLGRRGNCRRNRSTDICANIEDGFRRKDEIRVARSKRIRAVVCGGSHVAHPNYADRTEVPN